MVCMYGKQNVPLDQSTAAILLIAAEREDFVSELKARRQVEYHSRPAAWKKLS